MEFKFLPLEEFEWWREYDDGTKDLIGLYVPGNSYNCTKQPRHDALRAKCVVWEQEGKIKVLPLFNEKFITIEVQKDGDPA